MPKHYAFLDESGDISSGLFFVIAVVIADYLVSRAMARHLKRLRKTQHHKASSELKATNTKPASIRILLRNFATEGISIISVVLDSRDFQHKSDDKKELYAKVVSQAVYLCALRWPDLELKLDKRYTNKALRNNLSQVIYQKLNGIENSKVAITHEDSRSCPGIQVADFICWSIRKKYEDGYTEFYDIIKHKILEEMILGKK
jgi:hypothetical protein